MNSVDPRATCTRLKLPPLPGAEVERTPTLSQVVESREPGSRPRPPTVVLAQAARRLRLASVILPAAITMLVALEIVLDHALDRAEPRSGLPLVLGTGAGLELLSLGVLALTRNTRRPPANVPSVSASRAGYEAHELGSYRLVRLLGKGGMGEVWQAEHRILARPAAIKLVQLARLVDETEETPDSCVRWFEEEATATASLHSPHTVSLYDFGIADDGTPYYVMELLSGLDLDSLVRQFGPISAARTVYILKQVCDSLAEAHQAGLVHRDVKPANIFLCRLGLEHDFVKVLDFGLVANAGGLHRSVVSCPDADRMVAGTPAFMAPETVAGFDDVDGRADIYALGCVGYWLLTGTPVFDARSRTPSELLDDHARVTPERPSIRLGKTLPHGLEALVLQCLEKDRRDRPWDAVHLKRRLEALELELDEAWGEAHARTWWIRNLRALAVPAVGNANQELVA